MSGEPPAEPPGRKDGFLDAVEQKAARKLKAQRDGPGGVWFGLGMSGIIGWSIAVPTLVGAFLGIWIDSHHPGKHSWTLMLLVIGLAVGCLNAWRWLSQQRDAMDDKSGDANE